MSNTIKFNKTLLASVVAASMLTACGGDDNTTVEPAAVEVAPPNVTVEPPVTNSDVDVVVEAPEVVTTTLSGSVMSYSSRAAVGDVTVTAYAAGQMFTAMTDSSGMFTLAGLPQNSEATVSFKSAGHATYTHGVYTGDSAGINLENVTLVEAGSVTISVMNMAGNAVTGATFYVSADDLDMLAGGGAEASDIVATAGAVDGTYVFSGLPVGMTFDIESSPLYNSAGEMLEFIMGDTVKAASSAGANVQSTSTSQYVYVDSMENPTTFDLALNLEYMGYSLVDAPASIDLMVGGDTVSATLMDGTYYVTLSAEQALQSVVVAPVDGLVASEVVSTGLSSFSGGDELALTLALEEMSEGAEELTSRVLSSNLVAGESAEIVIAFNRPVTVISDSIKFKTKELKDTAFSSTYVKFDPEGYYQYVRPTVLGDCVVQSWNGASPCRSFENMYVNPDYFGNGILYATDQQVLDNLGETTALNFPNPRSGRGMYLDRFAGFTKKLYVTNTTGFTLPEENFSWNEAGTVLTVTMDATDLPNGNENLTLPLVANVPFYLDFDVETNDDGAIAQDALYVELETSAPAAAPSLDGLMADNLNGQDESQLNFELIGGWDPAFSGTVIASQMNIEETAVNFLPLVGKTFTGEDSQGNPGQFDMAVKVFDSQGYMNRPSRYIEHYSGESITSKWSQLSPKNASNPNKAFILSDFEFSGTVTITSVTYQTTSKDENGAWDGSETPVEEMLELNHTYFVNNDNGLSQAPQEAVHMLDAYTGTFMEHYDSESELANVIGGAEMLANGAAPEISGKTYVTTAIELTEAIGSMINSRYVVTGFTAEFNAVAEDGTVLTGSKEFTVK
ncbi:carboxypeptidase-like regulatory domain-containing protein [Thalassotalea crassostreae]|uniref:carboxypeptidase-like regulatory domain-containing protein n=1 Tax=Thalassotalea crassostreae TaxID=1763536 RepID=UPI0008390092|nr:carboxypeptidase-like regulatory domain-containing protein [Thalassotalea crassostreae]